jgi:TonB family protein
MLTQRALVRNGYPEVSVRMGQEGVNIVSFYLHPNGNITELRLEKAIGYTALDENTLRVIRIAYSEYPLPQMRTKIKFYVNYTIN